MLLRSLLCISALTTLVVADAPGGSDISRGYPLFFGSFEDVGESRVEHDVLSVKDVDAAITDWMRGCPADAFLIVRDSNPFELNSYKRLQRLAEQSITRGSFLTDYVLNTHELALDLEDYCEAEFVEVDTESPESVKNYIDTKPRVFYVEFSRDTEADRKELVLNNILRAIPSPFVTVIYTSTFQQAQPIFRSIELSPLRESWSRQRQRHNAEKITPIIAPLFQRKDTGHAAPDPVLDLPDHFFLTLLVASVFVALFLAYNDWKAGQRRKTAPAPAPAPASASKPIATAESLVKK